MMKDKIPFLVDLWMQLFQSNLLHLFGDLKFLGKTVIYLTHWFLISCFLKMVENLIDFYSKHRSGLYSKKNFMNFKIIQTGKIEELDWFYT
jgi:hypothetical protein